jgi:type I restriction enzyme S subunit
MRMEPLGDHVRFIRGVTFKPADKCEVGGQGSLVCLRTANVQETLDETDLIAIPASLVKSPEKIVRSGDVLVSSANSWNLVGKCCRVESLKHPSTAGGFISILRATSSELDPAYLYRWFASDRTQATVRSFGNQTTNISNLDHKRTLALHIPLPTLIEQKRIAAILDAADALRAKQRESIEQLDSLIQATFLEMFGDPVTNPRGWEATPLSEIGEYISGATPSKQQEEYWEGNTPWVSPKDMKVNYIRDSQDHVSDKALQETGLKRIDPLHILVVVRGMILAHSFPVALNLVPVAINQDMKAIRLRATLEPRFALVCLQQKKRELLAEVSTAGHGTKRFDAQGFKSVMMPLPPLDLQSRFASIVESIEQQKARLKAHLAELDTLFASLQSRAFNGELVA